MDISHQRPGDMIISLSSGDLYFMRRHGYVVDGNGLSGLGSKTWVRQDGDNKKPNAQIDGTSDVYVYLPNGEADLPVRIEQGDMDPYMDQERDRLAFHFGEAGAIVVRAAEEE